MLLSASAVAVCCSVILSGRAAAMQYAVLQPFPMDDDDPNSGARLPWDATRSEWNDEKVHGRRQQAVPWMNPFALVTRSREKPPALLGASPPLPRDLGPASGPEDLARRDVGTAGAGFGAACGPRERCSSSLGLACLKTEHEDSHCGCATETPVFINEGGVKKCVRAKAMYESCMSHLECSYKNPNLQCVDFLCYCPLPYVLTEAHRCLAPSAPHNTKTVAIAPAAVLIAVVVLVGGAYTYRNGLLTLRSGAERPSDSTRRVSSDIRQRHKAGARRLQHSLDEHRVVLRDAGGSRRPPRYIRPREQSVQQSFLQDVRASTIKEESTLPSEPPGFTSNRLPPRCAGAAASKAVRLQRILPVHREESVHIIHKCQTSEKTSQDLSSEVPWLRQARRTADRRQSPTRLLRRMLDEAEVKVNVDRNCSSDNKDAQRPQPPKFFGDHSISQPSVPSICKLHEPGNGESTTEDSFMRELRYQVKASSPRPSVQDRGMSTDVAFTKESAVQLDQSVLGKVDRSQQMSDVPNLGVDDTAIAPVRKLIQIIERKSAVPVEKFIQKIEPKQTAVNKTKPSVEKEREERIVKSELTSPKDMRKTKHEKCDTSLVQGKEEQSIFGGKPLRFLGRIFSDSLTHRSDQHVARDLLPSHCKRTKGDSQNPLKSDFVRVTTDNVKCMKKTNKDGGMNATVPTSPKLSRTVISDVSKTRCPAFKDVLQELIQQQTQKKASVMSPGSTSNKKIPEKAPPQPSGHSSTTVEGVTCTSPARTNFPPKVSLKESPVLRKPPKVTWNLSPAMSPRFYTTIVQETDMLCPSVQGTAKAVSNETSLNETRSDRGKPHHERKYSALPSSLNFPTTAVEEAPPRHVRSFSYAHTVRDDGKQDDKRTISMQRVGLGRSSDDLITNAEKKPSKMYVWGDSFSGSGETPSHGSRFECYASLKDPGNEGPGQAISMRQGLEATEASTGVGLEQTFILPKIENNWNMASPEATLGSMDLESSETSLGGLRTAFKQSVDVSSRTQKHRDETTVMVDAQKVNNSKRSEQEKRVNFQEKPFADVLAELEDSSEPEFAEGDKKGHANEERLVGKSVRCCKAEDEENFDRTFIESRGDAAEKTGNREVEDSGREKIKDKAKHVVAVALEGGAGQASKKIMEQVTTQGQHAGADRYLVECVGPVELATHNSELYLAPSRRIWSEDNAVSHPFCRSEEGPLLPSASTTLSFLSSDSGVSVVHRVTDLTTLQALADLAAPFQETGDGKSRTEGENLPNTAQSVSYTPQELHQSQREPLPQHQEGEQQWKGHHTLSSPRATADDRSARLSRRLRMLEQAKRQDSREDRRSSRPPKRPNTGERQRVGRFAAKERRWGDDIIRVIFLGNKHYLNERSTTSPRPLSSSMAAVPPLDETQYIAQQIELIHATDKDVAHTCPSPELCLAAGVVQTVAVPEETVITTAHPRDLSDCGGMQALARASDAGLDQHEPSSPSTRVSQQPSPGTCCGPQSAVTLPDPLAAAHHSTWGPCGEKLNVETIAEAVYEMDLQDPQSIAGAVRPKVSELGCGYAFSGDMIELLKSPVQIAAVENSTNHVVPSLISELEAESRLTPHHWDVRESHLPASVKLLSAAMGTPESFSKTIGLPSPDGLLLSDTSTLASRVGATASSSTGCRVVLEPSASALSHARTGSPMSARSRRHSPKIGEDRCFESIYNSILQAGSSPEISLSIPMLGSRVVSDCYGVREMSTSECSIIPCLTNDCRDGGAVPIAATTSRFVPEFTAPKPSAAGSHVAVPYATCAAAAYGEDREEPIRRTPPFSGEAAPRKGSRCSPSHPSTTAAILHSQAGVGNMLNGHAHADVGSETEERSSYFSFEESASETSLLPDAAAMDWRASSAASRSRADLG